MVDILFYAFIINFNNKNVIKLQKNRVERGVFMSQIRDELNSHHLKTLEALDNKTNLSWHRVKNLLIYLNIPVKTNDGSRVKASFNGAVLCLHKPHGKTENRLSRGHIREIRNFLHAAHII